MVVAPAMTSNYVLTLVARRWRIPCSIVQVWSDGPVYHQCGPSLARRLSPELDWWITELQEFLFWCVCDYEKILGDMKILIGAGLTALPEATVVLVRRPRLYSALA